MVDEEVIPCIVRNAFRHIQRCDIIDKGMPRERFHIYVSQMPQAKEHLIHG
jgi:hypothetical protein